VAVKRINVSLCVCREELKFTATPSSMLAAASVLSAANGLLGVATAQKLQLVDRLHHITAIETVRIMLTAHS